MRCTAEVEHVGGEHHGEKVDDTRRDQARETAYIKQGNTKQLTAFGARVESRAVYLVPRRSCLFSLITTYAILPVVVEQLYLPQPMKKFRAPSWVHGMFGFWGSPAVADLDQAPKVMLFPHVEL